MDRLLRDYRRAFNANDDRLAAAGGPGPAGDDLGLGLDLDVGLEVGADDEGGRRRRRRREGGG